ncbi:ATP binding protein [Dorcoceras hygrometricum]|uniref:ATP binding protein n=1 Tax=Dorcoceras hygrometricum TaxID=472368 RepID=A0A2Z7APF4_9LAMI|nr:ATP binding protein [Dorcoceras hygrometricum]
MKSRKQVSLVGTRSPIKRSWARIISAIHDPQKYGPFNPYIPIRSMTIDKSRVAIDPIAMPTSWRSNSDIASVTSIGYPRMSASGEFKSMTIDKSRVAIDPIAMPTSWRSNSDIASVTRSLTKRHLSHHRGQSSRSVLSFFSGYIVSRPKPGDTSLLVIHSSSFLLVQLQQISLNSSPRAPDLSSSRPLDVVAALWLGKAL